MNNGVVLKVIKETLISDIKLIPVMLIIYVIQGLFENIITNKLTLFMLAIVWIMITVISIVGSILGAILAVKVVKK